MQQNINMPNLSTLSELRLDGSGPLKRVRDTMLYGKGIYSKYLHIKPTILYHVIMTFSYNHVCFPSNPFLLIASICISIHHLFFKS